MDRLTFGAPHMEHSSMSLKKNDKFNGITTIPEVDLDQRYATGKNLL